MISLPQSVSSYIEEGFSVSLKEETKNLLNSCRAQTVNPGETVVHQGDSSSSLFLILKGIVRGYYIDDNGNDITKCFSAENQFYSTEGFRTGKKSSFNIETLEETTSIVLPYKLIQKCMEMDKAVDELVSTLFLNEVGNLEKRNRTLMLLDAEERYISFSKEYPDLNSRLPLKYIASYICIQFPSLSRIRKKLREMNRI